MKPVYTSSEKGRRSPSANPQRTDTPQEAPSVEGVEIERKFLLKFLPKAVLESPGTRIRQGYLAHDGFREVRVRHQGRKHFLTMKEGSGLMRGEVEIPITAKQFSALWPRTEGRRVEKIRTVLELGGVRLEIDRYQGDLAPLLIGEVEFSSVKESSEFEKPKYFGTEVTDNGAYRNVSLAIHGLPHQSALKYELGALPTLRKGGRLHLVLVSNCDRSRWIIPKRQPEPKLTRRDAAIMGAVEQAGVIGTLHSGLHSTCRRKDQRTLSVYALNVTTVLKKWPQMEWRQREILPVAKALKRISDPDLAKCIQRLAAKLEE